MRQTAAVIALATLLAVSPAYAGLHVCNKTVKTVWVAIAWDQAPGQFASTVSWGWIKADPGACVSAQDQPLETDGSASYYALVRDSDGFWGSVRSQDEGSGAVSNVSGSSFCFKTIDDFKSIELHSLRDTPPTCERHDYFLLETNRQSDFTMTLLPR